MKNKQQIFIKFAKEKQFDHLNAKKWYEADLSQVPIPMVKLITLSYKIQKKYFMEIKLTLNTETSFACKSSSSMCETVAAFIPKHWLR